LSLFAASSEVRPSQFESRPFNVSSALRVYQLSDLGINILLVKTYYKNHAEFPALEI
jgi:hypothetical protein